jgi:hypothetical protein
MQQFGWFKNRIFVYPEIFTDPPQYIALRDSKDSPLLQTELNTAIEAD